MTIRQQIGEVQRSGLLDNAKFGFCEIRQGSRGHQGPARRCAGVGGCPRRIELRLQTMLQTPIDTAKVSDDILTKSAVAIGSVGGTTWGDALAPLRQSSVAFAQSLAPISAFDRMFPDFTRMPLHRALRSPARRRWRTASPNWRRNQFRQCPSPRHNWPPTRPSHCSLSLRS